MSEFGPKQTWQCATLILQVTRDGRCSEQIYQAGLPDRLAKASSDRSSTIVSQAIVARCSDKLAIIRSRSRYTRERISYWLSRPAALELGRSQDGRNEVCLRRTEG